MSLLEERTARLNIEHFRKRLVAETDETRRRLLEELLAAEERKLEALLRERDGGEGA